MRILVLGGDGFCGWPTALRLSAAGHGVTIGDDFSRRIIDNELGTNSLTPIRSMSERIRAWGELTERAIGFDRIDLAQDEGLIERLVEEHDAVVHFAEQRAAPYSMKTPVHRHWTVARNVGATTALLNALLKHPRPLVHLGTLGVYGYSDGELPEGWVEWGEEWRLHPMRPGSVYHATKCMDQVLFEFYSRNDRLAITDLHQGVVWGTQTEETSLDERLINRFDYDGDYGTVLNRFLMQAAVGHPLTVHGTGGQTRGFIHIRDTVECVRLALETPPKWGEYRIFNQVAECQRVRDLARKVGEMTGAEVRYVENPRKEAAENELAAENQGLKGLGWEPTTLDEGLMDEVVGVAHKYLDRADWARIPCESRW